MNQSRFKSRKILRKEARKAKKTRRNEYYMRKGSKQKSVDCDAVELKSNSGEIAKSKPRDKFRNVQEHQFNEVNRERKKREKLDVEIRKKRIERLKEDNLEEEKGIKKLEKQLKFRKGKRTGAFSLDGLDYLLDVCDSKLSKNDVERTFQESDSDFDEDLAFVTGKRKHEKESKKKSVDSEIESDLESGSDCVESIVDENDFSDGEEESGNELEESKEVCQPRRKRERLEEEVSESGEGECGEGVWQDIYGRMRDKAGNVVKTYKPPQLRKLLSSEGGSKNQEKLLRLKRQLKGLINRLAENNMASISNQVEALYMSNSRNEMNETLKELYSDAIISEVLTPERLITEHAMLIAVLHANVGSEVGAYFLQFAANQFDKLLKENSSVEDKRINNLMLFLMHLYNFQLCHSRLMYDMVNQLLTSLDEKRIELVLLMLRTVGFSLRKDDPAALKSLVLKIQEQANAVKAGNENYTRMKFMLEVVSAVKNNNVSKIPNYNPELVEHLKKSLKVLIRKGNYKTELNISLQDLLNAEEHGRWWVVGSAWSGRAPTEVEEKKPEVSKASFSQKLLDLAKKQRMNTDVRRTIFCTLMSAEDYLDAFEKLLKLGLKGAVEREIVNVLLHCAMQEKEFNPYYYHLANKFCLFDRKYQMMVQCAVWDKVKDLGSLLPVQITNLAKLIGSIILGKGLPLSVLKVIQFSELDKSGVKFMRQVLLTILLTDEETVANVFTRVTSSGKLKIFRDGIRLFLHHFLLKNVKSAGEESDRLAKMIEIADKILTSTDLKLIF